MTSLALAFQDALRDADSCTSFQQALGGLEGEEKCSLGGTESLQILQTACQDAPSFAGQAVLDTIYQNCRSPGQTLGGTLNLDLAWDGEDLSLGISTPDFSFNGTFYSIQKLTVAVDPAGRIQCSGSLLVQGEICVPTPDCNFCPL